MAYSWTNSLGLRVFTLTHLSGLAGYNYVFVTNPFNVWELTVLENPPEGLLF
jgi:hypothetical protein